MPEETTERIRIRLEGDWSMSGVADQFPRLAELLASPPLSRPDRDIRGDASWNRPEIDMTGIESLDACGCQLLTAFLHNLKLTGVTPLLTGISATIGEKIRLLGFDRLFAANADFIGECA